MTYIPSIRIHVTFRTGNHDGIEPSPVCRSLEVGYDTLETALATVCYDGCLNNLCRQLDELPINNKEQTDLPRNIDNTVSG